MSIDVSFIIPHKGRIQLLIQTIDSIIHQNFDLSLVEIIIVTQNGDLDISLFNLGKSDNLEIVKRPVNDTISALRNVGARHSKGKFLAFLDADIGLSTNWINSAISELQNSEFILIGGSQVNSEIAPPIEKIRTALSNAELDCKVNFLPGCNLLIEKTDFNKSEGFPEDLITCEDYYFSNKLRSYGEIYHSSKATFVHLGEDKNFSKMFKKEIWRGQSNLLSIRGRDISIREIPSIISPLMVIILLLSSILFLINGNILLGLVSLSILIFIYLSYVLRLKNLIKGEVGLWYLVKFYIYYFPARAIGTFLGLFQSLLAKK